MDLSTIVYVNVQPDPTTHPVKMTVKDLLGHLDGVLIYCPEGPDGEILANATMGPYDGDILQQIFWEVLRIFNTTDKTMFWAIQSLMSMPNLWGEADEEKRIKISAFIDEVNK